MDLLHTLRRFHGRRRLLTCTAAIAAALCGGGTAGAAGVAEVSAGGFHTCALLADHTVDCWGKNESGQLGNGTTEGGLTPAPVPGLTEVTQVSAGGSDTCALRGNGGVVCWGEGTLGQLGDGGFESSPVPVAVIGLGPAVAIQAGWDQTCALLVDRTVACWGDNEAGQLGDGGFESSPTPVPVSGLTEVSALAVGWGHACAAHTAAGSVVCWGENNGRQLGDGTTEDRPAPVSVPGVTGAIGLGAGDLYTCARLEGGGVECWGQLQFEGETAPPSPTPIALSAEATALTVGGFHACALLAGSAECWGEDSAGQFGDGNESGGLRLEPVPVLDLAGATSISAGAFHTCAVVAGGVECWGANESGQLGDGNTVNSSVRTTVTFPPAGGASTAAPPSSLTPQQPAQAAQTPAPAPTPTLTPVFGKTVVASPVAGRILVKAPGGHRFVPLAGSRTIPLDSVVDARRGTIEFLAAGGPGEGTQPGRFTGGVFRVTQKLTHTPFESGRVGLTVLTLVGGAPRCGGEVARASSRGHGGNHLWGEESHAHYGTGGRFASATVSGTRWLTAETCAGTLVKVARGAVSVADKVRHVTVTVTAPHTYLARSPKK